MWYSQETAVHITLWIWSEAFFDGSMFGSVLVAHYLKILYFQFKYFLFLTQRSTK